MAKTGDVLTFLRGRKEYVSGDFISARLCMSRTAVWKRIHQLEGLGYEISRRKGTGYRLVETPDKLYPWEIEKYLDTGIIGKNLVYKEIVDSTNALAFKLALGGAPEGTCVLAEAQESGRGRLNRTWFSPAGENLYLSVILRPRIHPSNVYPVTFISSLAVCDAIEAITSIKPTLKWPNDVLINGKKVCGTLLELATETDAVSFVVVGIGLNINMGEQTIHDGINQKATSLSMETRKTYERAYVCGNLLSSLERYYLVLKEKGGAEMCRVWEDRAGITGKYLEIIQMGQLSSGVCQGVDSQGALLLKTDGKVNRIIAGDVSF